MTQAEYNSLLRRLNSPEDAQRVGRETGIPHSTLMSLLAHKMVRETMALFYKVKARSRELHSHWEKGKSLTEVSRYCRIAPTLCASFILSEKGFSKKMFREAVRNPESLKDARLKKELADAIREDFIYSDWAAAEQRERGEKHERNLEKWLAAHGYDFWTEKDRAGEEKTPDFLLKKSAKYRGRTVHWFESKGYFGDSWEMKRNYN
ncbi:MAG: TPD domain-containing protein [Candidatus ainarchaeum sp.]|nr:TPD domain-containing protein [Candidatus ainarchaeum sp.]